ncbi:hypothetical protein N7492_005551 [Penicillium capsulatum]|uniref:Uncharacterized protein n=1 Tax=Penicillium capsulatum TaxID=69766 RepID=A0A9W9LS87_9EURO|nr:hypothetical protein N7492_005551 [Penicillium capsulatum]
MAPDISAIVNRIYYANELSDAAEVTLPRKKMAQAPLEWNKTSHISLNSNVISLDVRNAGVEKVGHFIIDQIFAEYGISLC